MSPTSSRTPRALVSVGAALWAVTAALLLLVPSPAAASVPRDAGAWEASPSALMNARSPVSVLETSTAEHPGTSPFDLFNGGELARAALALDLGAREERLGLELEPGDLGIEPLRGPPELDGKTHRGEWPSYPKTRIGGIGLFLGTGGGAEEKLSLGLHWVCGVSRCEVVEGKPQDPLGLAVKRTRSTTGGTKGKWSIPAGTMAPAPIGTEAPGYIPGGEVEVASATATGRIMRDLGELHAIGLDDVMAMRVLSSRYRGGEGEESRVQALAPPMVALKKPLEIEFFVLSFFVLPAPSAGAAVTPATAPMRLFHGTTRTAAMDIVVNGAKVSRGVGLSDDFGLGFYLTEDYSVAAQAASRRAASRGGSGAVVEAGISRADLGRVLELRRGSPYGDKFQKFLDSASPAPGRSWRSIYETGSEATSHVFDTFMKQERLQADTVFGPMEFGLFGSPGRSQVAIRSQEVADRLNLGLLVGK